MGPTMPPSKKAQSPSSGASASQGMSPPYRQGDATAAASEAEAADLSLSLSASFSKAEDEELTSLSWLHESTDLLNSFSHSGLRSVSPLQDPDSQHPRSPSSSSPSPDDVLLADAHSAYDLAAGTNRKPPYSFSCLIFMAIEDAPNKRLPVKDIYGWILEHFPYFANAPTGWKNSVRHNLSLNKCFKKVDKDRSQELRLDDGRFQRYFRLSRTQFEDLLSRIRRRIGLRDNNYRHYIPAAERLSICLR
ncbi:hypothetical protein ILYODFUR_021761 [Ilyodon furcidens]|uniref:Fork-head domain-containing protein n=1 Tax=Ilyodon furcidens TaxID=33524 RepID=A0ABV0SN88_9TELE